MARSDAQGSSGFPHEKLGVYRAAVEFAELAQAIIARLPKGRSNLADQLDRASTSIVLNIAEGSGEFSPQEKRRFYRIALRSAAECAACLDLIALVGAPPDDQGSRARDLLRRTGAMLGALSRQPGVLQRPAPTSIPIPTSKTPSENENENASR